MKKIFALIFVIAITISVSVMADNIASGIFDEGTVTTTNSTPTAVLSINVATSETYVISAEITGKAENDTDHGLYYFTGLFCRSDTGNVTQCGSTISLAEIETQTNWNGYLSANTTNQTIDVLVQGFGSTNINWGATIKYRKVE